MAVKVKTAINRQYKVLNIDEDGYFKSMLLLRKKKYAALKLEGLEEYDEKRESEFQRNKKDNRVVRKHEVVDNKTIVYKFKREAKGLDLVRRDWSLISRNTSVRILDSILAAQSRDETVSDIRSYLSTLARKMDNNEIDVNEYVLTKSLTKSLDQYSDAKGLPHVSVARKLANSGKFVRAGDVIEYLIIKNPQGLENVHNPSQADKAMHKQEFINLVNEFKRDSTKYCPNIDIEFYKETQILNPIMRLCDVFEEITKASLAESLGIDASKYRYQNNTAEDNDDTSNNYQLQNYELFKNCNPLYIRCPQCNIGYPFPGVFNYVNNQTVNNQGEPLTIANNNGNSQKEPLNAGNLVERLHDVAYLTKLNVNKYNHGFICPSSACSGCIIDGDENNNVSLMNEINNTITYQVRELMHVFNQHTYQFQIDEFTSVLSNDFTVKSKLPSQKDINAKVEALCIQLRYYLSLFDYEDATKALDEEYEARVKKYGGKAAYYKTVDNKQDVNTLEWNSNSIPLGPLKFNLSKSTLSVLNGVKAYINSLLDQSNFFNINLKAIFDDLFI